MSNIRVCTLASAAFALVVTAAGQTGFVNWENQPLHSAEITPDGTRLLIANTPDNRVELFDLTGAVPQWVTAIPVGLDPVSVRARTDNEVWVVNHISDSVSIVDLTTLNVVRTLRTLDEPYDVVFAGAAGRAFVSCSQANTVLVFDPANLDAPPTSIAIDAEDPRALAVSPDGSKVYVAIFESGNKSTILGGGADVSGGRLGFPPNVVDEPSGPHSGINPPPNHGAAFEPPQAPGNPAPPRVGMIVKQNAAGQWMDDNGGDWTNFVSGPQAGLSGRPVGWNLPDRDVAIIDADTLALSWATGLMNICMALDVRPANATTGLITVVGLDAINEVRFEPNVNGQFVRVHMATVDPQNPAATTIVDLNPHLSYTNPTVAQSERDRSIGDPRGIVWTADGSRAFVTGMGSNNVIVIDAAGQRAGLAETIEVGEGPIGLALDEPRGKLYVHNRFAATLSVIDLTTETQTAEVPFYDPTPAVIRIGRKHLYDTHLTSGLGQSACASCHIDARIDRLAWDLGDPSGAVISIAGQNLGAGIPGLTPGTTPTPFENFHPMKGPMTTQTLQDIIGHEPLHWRGDRDGLEEFNGAFMGLLGDDELLSPAEMQEFEDFLATITFPPNPFRNRDNTLPTNLPLPGHYRTGRFGSAGQPLPNGNAQAGLTLYRSTQRRLDANAFACVTCHTLPTGAGTDMVFGAGNRFNPIPVGPNGEHHLQLVSVDGSTNRTIKTPQLRNLYEKVGFEATQVSNRAGFGFLHDGSVDSLARFVSEPVFSVANDQEVANLVAFLLAFAGSDLPQGSPTNILEPPGPPSKDTHAFVGWQTTLVDLSTAPADQTALINEMITRATAGAVGLVVKGRVGGIPRGYALVGGMFQSDRAAEALTPAALQALAEPGSELTFTVVPRNTHVRIGIDRDADGFFDRDEIEDCGDPNDPAITPGFFQPGDSNGDGLVNNFDIDAFVLALTDPAAYALAYPAANYRCNNDCNGDGEVNNFDIDAFVALLGG